MNVPEDEIQWYEVPLTLDKKEDNTPYKQWQVSSDGSTYYPDIKPKIAKSIKPGLYEVFYSREEGYFTRIVEINHDNLVELRELQIKNVIQEVQRFWKKKEAFKTAKIFYKRGVLLHGTPGQGKTSTIDLICEEIIKIKGIAFRVNSITELKNTYEFLKSSFKKIQPDTPFVVIVEDIDKLLREDESYVSNVLDGKDSLEGQLIVATTNRLHEISDIILRPSRFDQLVPIEELSREDKIKYLESFKLDKDKVDSFIKVASEFTMAQLKELFVGTELLENSLEEMAQRISGNQKKVKVFSGEKTGKKVGFNN